MPQVYTVVSSLQLQVTYVHRVVNWQLLGLGLKAPQKILNITSYKTIMMVFSFVICNYSKLFQLICFLFLSYLFNCTSFILLFCLHFEIVVLIYSTYISLRVL